ncbi:MAG TPA: glycosyltransferase family 4 protein [Vicinamibacterales bacterium]|nr:glycosyltransferase family 4 protein [Vicinamibacterales bacterium]
MSSLRILHVVPFFEGAWAYGGIPRAASAMARGLARRGHHVTVCTTDACDSARRLRADDGGPSLPGLDVRIFPNVSNHLAYHWQAFAPLGLRRFLRDAADAFDIAHLHACRNLPGVAAARALGRAGVPYLLSPNGTAPAIERRILAKRLFDAAVGRRIVAGASRVLAVSQAEREQLMALGLSAHRVPVVPNPLDEQEFADVPEGSTFRRAHGLGSNPVVMFLGKLTPRKGVDVLLRAAALLARTPVHLVVAGNDMGSGRSVDRLTRRLGLTRRVTRVGLLRGRERLEALAAADVVVYPSRDEAFGLVPLEALLCGTPVIVSNDSGCGEIVGMTGGGWIVPYGDPRILAQAIEEVLGAPGPWRLGAREAAERVRRLFGSDSVCEQLEGLYLDVLASRQSAVAVRQSQSAVSRRSPVAGRRSTVTVGSQSAVLGRQSHDV